jgi:chaperonin GroEL (HSP60 family)
MFMYVLQCFNVLFFSHSVGIVVTNDGNAILREIDIAHPAAKVCQILLFTFLSLCS